MEKKITKSFDRFVCANVCFFDAYPSQSGSGVVCWDFFQSIPIRRKKFFQLNQKTVKNKFISNIKIYRNNPFFKILSIPSLIKSISSFLDGNKKKILIIEGPSWAFYSFILISFFKFFKKNLKIIYRSHSIEYEIRKNNSNIFIRFLTFFFENMIFKLSDVSTSVSKIEQKKIKQYYKKKTILFPNCINYELLKKLKIKKIKKLPYKFIFYCGSYKYAPNKKAIDTIINKILPELKSKNIHFVFTGDSSIKFDDKYVINLQKVEKSELKYLYKKCLALILPITEGYGTRIKVLEALAFGVPIVSTPKGVEGINTNNVNFIKITKNIKKFPHYILSIKKDKIRTKFEYNMNYFTKTFFKNLF